MDAGVHTRGHSFRRRAGHGAGVYFRALGPSPVPYTTMLITASLLLLCTALTWPGPVAAGGGPRTQDLEGIFSGLTLDAARARAGETGQLVLLELASADAAESAAFDLDLWTDAEAVRWVEVECVAVRFEGAEAERLAGEYGVETRPAILLIEPDGLELRRMEAPLPGRKFSRNVRIIVSKREAISEARGALEAAPDDVRLRLTYAQVLVDAHMFSSALEQFDRVWEEGRGLESFKEDRLGLVVRTVNGMSQMYPKARGTLQRWRKAAMKELAEPLDISDPERLKGAAEEVGAINVRLDQTEPSLALFRRLKADPTAPQEAIDALFNRHVFQVLYNQKEFAELLDGCGDVFVRVDQAFGMYEGFLARKLSGELPEDEYMFVDALRNSAMIRASRYYEALLMTANLEEARDLASVVCNRLPHGDTYVTLMSAAKRARDRDEVRRLAEEAFERLTELEGVGRVREMYDKLPTKQH